MRKIKKETKITDYKRVFEEGFKELARCRNYYEVWADLMELYSITIANQSSLHYKQHKELSKVWNDREERYLKTIKKYDKAEQQLICEMFSYLVLEFERNPYQDLLGSMYMLLGISNDVAGQFFTPYDLCKLMSDLTGNHEIMRKSIKEKGYFNCYDCACGGGATLIGFAEKCNEEFKRLNYRDHVYFVGQDVDLRCVQMCYIQLSLIGVAGFVIHGNTLTQPVVNFFKDNANIWVTPYYNSSVWQMRIMSHGFGMLMEDRNGDFHS